MVPGGTASISRVEGSRTAREVGWRSATTTHAGTNKKGDDLYRLKRIMIDENAELHVIATHACGGFDFLARFGLDLAE